MTGYGCAYDDDCANTVNWILTSISPAFTISLCDDHMAPGVIPLLGANIGVEAGKLYESIKRFTDREAAREAREAQQQQPGDQAADKPEPPQPDDPPAPGATAERFWPGMNAGADIDEPEPAP